jgi:hypothetical protein
MKRPLVGFVVLAAIAFGMYGLVRPPEPAPLPAGATSLVLRTQPPEWGLPGQPRGCSLAGVTPVRVARSGDTLIFESPETGRRVPLVFPHGFTARLVADRAELVSPAGVVVAREGDIVDGLMGAAAESGDLVLCFDGATRLQVTSESTRSP